MCGFFFSLPIPSAKLKYNCGNAFRLTMYKESLKKLFKTASQKNVAETLV